MHKFSTKLLYLLIPVFIAGILAIDIFMHLIPRLGSDFQLPVITFSLQNLRTLIILALAGTWYFTLKSRFLIADLELSQKLWRFTILLTANFIGIFFLKLIFSGYIDIDLDSAGALSVGMYIMFNNLQGLLAIALLIPILMIIRELIFYKQRRTTRLYFNLFILLILISSLWGYYSGKVLNFSVLLFQNEEFGIYNTILGWSLVIVTAFLSFRNDWITYLPRREKFIYFLIGAIVFGEIVLLRDAVYIPYLPNYSVVIANFAMIMCFFLLIYGGFALITLLVHLPTARAVDRKLKEVNSLYEFARKLTSQLNYQKLPQMITQITGEVLESQSTWLELYDSHKNKLKLISHINLTQQQIFNNPFDEMGGFNTNLIQGKSPILINDLSQNPQLRHITRWKKDIRTLMAAPLYSTREQLMGVIYTSKSQPYAFDVDDVSLLEGFANQSAIALENANLWQSSIERERLEQELKVAREVQLKLVPQTMPVIPSLTVDTYFLTAYEVGGDYYDFMEFGDQMPCMVIGDVSGKGTSAAFYMAEFKGVIQTLARTLTNPKDLICQANRIFYSTIERKSFVTAIVGKFDTRKKTFEFVRAGHNPVLYYCQRISRAQYIQPPGLGIGLESGTLFDSITESHKIQIYPGDFLMLFTDGLVEARNRFEEEFGEERLRSVAENSPNLSAEEIKDHILNEITDFIGDTPLHDDLTFIIIKMSDKKRAEKTNSER
jgi:serine phosphatase RsbU (regulator of sigma subunit)